MINILIVDDSDTEIALLKNLFDAERDFHVVGIAKNGKEALELTETLRPDVISMDLIMPVMSGIEAIRLIMWQRPTPIVVISSQVNSAVNDAAFLSLDAGALCVLDKPSYQTLLSESQRKRIVDTVRSMAEIKVVTRRFNVVQDVHASMVKMQPKMPIGKYEIVAIGTSIGGPQALRHILSQLPVDFPLPIVIVQHMTVGFIQGFTAWLNNNSKLHIKNAEDHEVLSPGTVYIAPDHVHFEIDRADKKLIAKLTKGEAVLGFCPSATVLFRSVAQVCGKNSIGILLTGMGSDGADGLLKIKQEKGHTLIQDAQSAVVFGMPGVAQSIGAADRVIALDDIAGYLQQITRVIS